MNKSFFYGVFQLKVVSLSYIGGNGIGSALNQLRDANGVYFDYLYTNSLYVVDSGNNRVLKFPPDSSAATFGIVVAGSSQRGNASNQLDEPRLVTVDIEGNLYITDGSKRK